MKKKVEQKAPENDEASQAASESQPEETEENVKPVKSNKKTKKSSKADASDEEPENKAIVSDAQIIHPVFDLDSEGISANFISQSRIMYWNIFFCLLFFFKKRRWLLGKSLNC